MADLILFILSSYAAWYVFSTAELPIWELIRDFLMEKSIMFTRFVLCPICSGFWISLVVSLIFPLTVSGVQAPNAFAATWIIAPLMQAFAGAGAIYLIEAHVIRLEER